ncbi:MAG: sensor histidine kinase [Coriobacteriaceae bacterium]|nr:sensor histidine kinase [Coriobacteriaceae bacterium]
MSEAATRRVDHLGGKFFLGRSILIDVLLLVTVTSVASVASVALIAPVPRYVFVAAVIGLTLIAVTSLVARLITRPDRLRAKQSHETLEIANRSLAHLRRGLDGGTADAVCRLVLEETDSVAAVAITDTERILGFAGVGEGHHTTGGPIRTRATRDAIEHNESRVLESEDEIGCDRGDCPLRAAIVVPLRTRGRPVGTLKFYYTSPGQLNETQVTMVEGLGELLSTQLELSELDRQTELACRMELQALQAQINPHFLFNTINTIASLVRTDPDEARHLLREFATFYRRTLESGEALIPLEREIEYVRSYLTFERARFSDRIVVEERLQPAAMAVEVPAFVVQPLVENAVQHGMRPRGSLHIGLEAEVLAGHLYVRVRDDGLGIAAEDLPRILEPGFGKGLGIALRNVDDRLKGHFGPGSGLSVTSEEGEGATVTLSIALEGECA